jgi:hypothetical protein
MTSANHFDFQKSLIAIVEKIFGFATIDTHDAEKKGATSPESHGLDHDSVCENDEVVKTRMGNRTDQRIRLCQSEEFVFWKAGAPCEQPAILFREDL